LFETNLELVVAALALGGTLTMALLCAIRSAEADSRGPRSS
jgi:hypothetical protein